MLAFSINAEETSSTCYIVITTSSEAITTTNTLNLSDPTDDFMMGTVIFFVSAGLILFITKQRI